LGHERKDKGTKVGRQYQRGKGLKARVQKKKTGRKKKTHTDTTRLSGNKVINQRRSILFVGASKERRSRREEVGFTFGKWKKRSQEFNKEGGGDRP